MPNQLDAEAIKEFEAEAKIGLIAAIDADGLPHITFISSLRAKSPDQLIWGQFCEGESKRNVTERPKTGWLVLTMDKKLWRGTAQWTHALTQEGEDYEVFNNTPMFRYNAYFGIHTVHYMDLVETRGREKLPLARIAASSILTKIAKSGATGKSSERVMKPWGEKLFNSLSSLKFLSYIEADGYPRIIPLLQCQAPDSRTLAFAPAAYQKELNQIKPGASVAVFGMTMAMESILVRGNYQGTSRFKGVSLSLIELDYVYNSMPPQQGCIYPQPELKPITEF